MTKEEAIRIIEIVFQDEYAYRYYDSITHQALDMAIEALKQVTGKLKKPDDSLLTADPKACKEQKSKLDLISRQAAIDALDQIFDRCEEIEAHLPEGDPDRTGYKMYPDYMTVWKYLHQRKKGEWLELTNTNHTYVCSVCGRMLVNITDGKNTVTKNYPFCHCGADMRSE